jgi:uncharacterized protein YndB with AHSA1/START domain
METENKTATRELVITRMLDAPREVVFKVWTEPRHLAQWWGPKYFTNPVCRWNAEPGNEIYIDMHSPDGVVYPMSGTFHEVVFPGKIVFISDALDDHGKPLFVVSNTVILTDVGGKTKMVLRVVVSDITPAGAKHLDGMNDGWNQSFDRLTECLAGQSTLDRELIITRLLSAPRKLVFDVWTHPDHIKNWWGPNGFTNTIYKMDVKPGGEWELVMHGPDGTDYKNKSIFREIVKPERIVYEHVTGPKFRATITLTEIGKKTLIRWSMLFDSKEEFEQVVKTFKADEGLKQNVEKLDQYLAAHGPIVIERTLNASPEKIWNAITDKNAMKLWYFDLDAFEAKVGFEFHFYGQGRKGEKYLHQCKITEVVANKKLGYSWRYEGYEGDSLVTFELVAEGDKTKIILTHEGVHTFAQGNSDFAKTSFTEGWTYIVGTALKNFVEG